MRERRRRQSMLAAEEECELTYTQAASRARDIKNHYLKIQGDLDIARKRLNNTQVGIISRKYDDYYHSIGIF